jgi:UDP-N-acetylglucosamine 3-dehydrogenase
MSRYRAGIVGLSWITSEPANPGTAPVLGQATPHTHLSAIAAIPAIEVVAGCDISKPACDLFRERWRGRWPEAKTYLDYCEMLANERLDLVCVATPDHLHAPVVIAAADAGVKAIFCEKPMAHRLADADEMIAAIERNHVVVNVNHTRRWVPSYVAAREAIRRGEIGALSQIVVQFGGPRAMLWRNHSHFLDLLGYFAEAAPRWVIAELEPGFEDYGTAYQGDGGRSPELEPGVNAYIGYANGVRGFLGGMKHSVQQISVDLIGAEGRILVNDQRAQLVLQTERGLSTIPITAAGTIGGMQAALVDLLNALETGETPQSPPRDAHHVVALIEGILASQAAGNAKVALA